MLFCVVDCAVLCCQFCKVCIFDWASCHIVCVSIVLFLCCHWYRVCVFDWDSCHIVCVFPVVLFLCVFAIALFCVYDCADFAFSTELAVT